MRVRVRVYSRVRVRDRVRVRVRVYSRVRVRVRVSPDHVGCHAAGVLVVAREEGRDARLIGVRQHMPFG